MKKLILLLLLTFNVQAQDGLYFYGGFEAFDDRGAMPEHWINSPNGVYGLYYKHNISHKWSVKVGIEHESSIVTKELGRGMNSVIVHTDILLW